MGLKKVFFANWMFTFLHVKGKSTCLVLSGFLSLFSVFSSLMDTVGKGGRNGMPQNLAELDGTGE